MDRWEELKTLVAVAETGSISAAAERLGIAKSAASRRLSEMEARLGVQLFQRTTRKIHPTDAGERLCERARLVLAEWADAEAEITAHQEILRGRLRMAVPLSFGLLHLAPALQAFLGGHPELMLDVDFNDRCVDLVHEGFDLAVRVGDLPDSQLVSRPIAPVRMVACAAPALLARLGRPQRPEDLGRYPALIYALGEDPERWRCTAADGRFVRIPVKARMRANNGDVLRLAALAGEGIALLPTFLLEQDLAHGRLEILLGDCRWPNTSANLLWPATRHMAAPVRAMVDFLVARFAGVPYWDRHLAGAPTARGPG